MRVLHVCNWCSGISTRNVNALKQFSRHDHELVTKVLHPYDMAVEPTHLTEQNTTPQMVLELAHEADALHFHAVGYEGTVGLPGTIHGIDWSQFLGKKIFILHGMCSDLQADGETFILRHGDRFLVRNLGQYNALMGPHLSCKRSYDRRLEYVPDIVPIFDWLYTPYATPRNQRRYIASFKEPDVLYSCDAPDYIRFLATPTKLTHQLAWRRRNCYATFDNSRDGHWGLFGIESLSQGVPSIAHTHEMNRECWRILDVPPPPFFECQYGGRDAGLRAAEIRSLSDSEWYRLSCECRMWVLKHYNPEKLVARWDSCYDSLN